MTQTTEATAALIRKSFQANLDGFSAISCALLGDDKEMRGCLRAIEEIETAVKKDAFDVDDSTWEWAFEAAMGATQMAHIQHVLETMAGMQAACSQFQFVVVALMIAAYRKGLVQLPDATTEWLASVSKTLDRKR